MYRWNPECYLCDDRGIITCSCKEAESNNCVSCDNRGYLYCRCSKGTRIRARIRQAGQRQEGWLEGRLRGFLRWRNLGRNPINRCAGCGNHLWF